MNPEQPLEDVFLYAEDAAETLKVSLATFYRYRIIYSESFPTSRTPGGRPEYSKLALLVWRAKFRSGELRPPVKRTSSNPKKVNKKSAAKDRIREAAIYASSQLK